MEWQAVAEDEGPTHNETRRVRCFIPSPSFFSVLFFITALSYRPHSPFSLWAEISNNLPCSQARTQLKVPWGWVSDARSLARHGYFEPGEGICAELESHGYSYIRPIMMNNYEIYLIGGSKDTDEDESYFVWNPTTGAVFRIKNNNLAEVMETMGRSILALELDDLETRGERGDSHGPTAG